MTLELLYYNDKVTVVNPDGYIGILTLWSRTDVIMKKLGDLPSSVAAIANLYGDGISQLLVNLLNNPQITHLCIIGNNRTDSASELINFFEHGVEEVKINGSMQCRIRNTTRLINSALSDPDLFVGRAPLIHDSCLEHAHLDDQIVELKYLLSLIVKRDHLPDRKVVRLVEPKIDVLPSVQQGHQIVTESQLDAWGELLFLIQRYGLPTALAKGDRKELMNLKVVITNPKWQTDDEYDKYNLSKQRLENYCKTMLEPVLESDTSYTYGNRLQEYFGYDMIEMVVQRLQADREDRKSYLSLWDARLDMQDRNLDNTPRGHPCWVGGFFRVYDGALTLSVTFRTHRAYTAWIENVHGLINLQAMVAGRLQLPIGPLTVISHSISIDPGQLPLIESIVNSRKWKLRNDNRGDVVFSINDGKAVVEHKMSGVLLKRYESANIEALSHQLAQDYIVSDLNHALYVGRQLGKLQLCLKNNLPYEEA